MRRPVEIGERVYLRRPARRDAEEIVALAAASRRLHGRWVKAPTTRAGFDEYLRRCRRPSVAGFLVCRSGDDAVAGVATLSEIVLGNLRSAYLGFYAFAPSAGQGLMSEGVRLVLGYAFSTLRLNRVEANVQPENLASMAFVERLGFRREGYSPRYLRIAGRWRDHVRWAILAEEFTRAGRRAR